MKFNWVVTLLTLGLFAVLAHWTSTVAMGQGCAGGCCPKAKRAAAANNNAPVAAVPVPDITWSVGSVTITPAETSNNQANKPSNNGDNNALNALAALEKARKERAAASTASIDQVESGKSNKQLTVLFVIPDPADDSKPSAAHKAYELFETKVLKTLEVATELKDCNTVKIEFGQLTTELKKQFGVSAAPQLLIIDANGKVLFRFSTTADAKTVAQGLKEGKAWNTKLAQKASK